MCVYRVCACAFGCMNTSRCKCVGLLCVHLCVCVGESTSGSVRVGPEVVDR